MGAVEEQSVDITLADTVNNLLRLGAVRLAIGFQSLVSVCGLVRVEASDGDTTVHVDKSTDLGSAVGLHSLADQCTQTKTLDEDKVHGLRSTEKLGKDGKIRADLSSLVKHVFGNVDGRRVTVVDAEGSKVLSHETHVIAHISPQERTVFCTLTISELDTVAPDNDLSAEVGTRCWAGIVLHGISCPDPAVVGESEASGVVRFRGLVLGQPCEVGFNEWALSTDLTHLGAMSFETQVSNTTTKLVEDDCLLSVILLSLIHI